MLIEFRGQESVGITDNESNQHSSRKQSEADFFDSKDIIQRNFSDSVIKEELDMQNDSNHSFGNIDIDAGNFFDAKKSENKEDLELQGYLQDYDAEPQILLVNNDAEPQILLVDDDAEAQILLVDDDAFNIFALQNMFESQL